MEHLPLSASQKNIYAFQKIYSNSPLYNLVSCFRLSGPVELGRLEASLRLYLSRNEILCYRFGEDDGVPFQFYDGSGAGDAVRVDVDSTLSPEVLEARAKELADGFVRVPVDLGAENLAVARVLSDGSSLHFVIFRVHHIIFDAYSMYGFTRFLSEAYSAPEGFNLSVAPQFKDFVGRGSGSPADGSFANHVARYCRVRPNERMTVRNRLGSRRELLVGGAAADAVATALSLRNASVFVFFASLAILRFHASSGRSRVVAGIPLAGRKSRSDRAVVGCFVNVLPMVLDFDEIGSFSELTKEVKRQLFLLLRNQDRDLESTQEELGYQRGADFDLVCNYYKDELDFSIPGVSVDSIPVHNDLAQYPFSVTVLERSGRYVVRYEYRDDRYDDAEIESFHASMETAILRSAAGAEIGLDALLSATGEESRRILEVFNATSRPYPRESTVIDLFERVVRDRVDATALVFMDRRVSYRELDARGNRLASALRAVGVRPGDKVGMLVHRGIDMIVGIIGILKAEAVYLPLDPDVPEHRSAFMVADAKVRVGLADTEAHLARLSSLGVVQNLTIDSSGDYEERVIPPNRGGGPLDPIYAMYTSGTTGKPKGTLVCNRNVARLVMNPDYVDIRPGDRMLQISNYAFDGSVFDIFGAMLNGAELHILPKASVLDVPALASEIATRRIDVFFVTTALFNVLVESAIDQLAGTRRVLFGGERASPKHVRKAFERLGPGRIGNVYGPTEATVFSTCHIVDSLDGDVVPIGAPIANSRIYILDPSGRLCPPGVAGELFIGGDGVALGYLNLEELTAERFVADPFVPGGKMYRSGDLGRWRADGRVEFLGRRDGQVKLRGFRIELDEVKIAIDECHGIADSAVVLRDGTLLAYVVGEDPSIEEDSILRNLEARLPDYMIPSRIVALDALPLTANGKVDADALPSPTDAVRVGDYIGPRTEEERLIAAAFAQTLGHDGIGAETDFFRVGGDSIRAIQLVGRLMSKGVQLSVKDVFDLRTVGALARALRPVDVAPRWPWGEGPFPLSPIQDWFFATWDGKVDHFNQYVALRRDGDIDEGAARAAVAALLGHHDILRARFPSDGDEVSPFIGSEADLGAAFLTYRLPSGRAGDASMGALVDDAQRSLGVADGVLARILLFRREDADTIVFVVHHLVVDGVSWRILLEDFISAYGQAIRGAIVLPPRTMSFPAWARSRRAYAESPAALDELGFWRNIDSARTRRIPTENRGPRQSGRVEVRLDRETTGLLLEAADGVDRFLLAALSRSLAECFGSGTYRVDVEGHGRGVASADEDTSRTIGWFTSVYPLLLECVDGESVKVLVEKIIAIMGTIPEKGRNYLCLSRFSSTSEAVLSGRASQIAFNYLGSFDLPSESGGFSLEPSILGASFDPAASMTHDLEFTGMIVEGHLSLSIVHRDGAGDAARTLLSAFEGNLKAVVAGTRRVDRRPQDSYALSPMQSGMLYHWMRSPESDAYSVNVRMRLSGAVDEEALRIAYNSLVSRHDVLRTVFPLEGGRSPLQSPLEVWTPEFYSADLSCSPNPPRALARFERADRARPFDLGSRPAFRLSALRTKPEEVFLLWRFHHILLDGWSLGPLLGDFLSLYKAAARNEAVHLPPSAPFRSYIDWLGKRDQMAARSYWKRYLEGFRTMVSVPELRAPPRSGEAGSVDIQVPAACAEALAALAQSESATKNSVAQCAWAILLQKYNGSDDVVFGYVVSGRSAEVPGIESMLGLCINTVPLRVKSGYGTTPRQIIGSIRGDLADSERWGFLPLTELQALTEVGNSLVSHAFAFENYPLDAALLSSVQQEANGFSIGDIDVDEGPNYDFGVVVTWTDKLTFTLRYGSSRSRAGVAAIGSHLLKVLAAIADAPDAPIFGIDLLSSSERRKVLSSFARRISLCPSETTVLDLFARYVRERPDEIAVECGEVALSYKELDARSGLLAEKLAAFGVGRDVTVLLMADRGVSMVVGIFGILKAGGAYVPIDPGYPDERIRYIVSNSGSPVAVADGVHAERLRELGIAATVPLAQDATHAANEPIGRNTLLPSDLAYVIYTSGTTGKPKGVMVEHRNLIASTCARVSVYGNTGRFLLLSSISFDSSVAGIFGSLCSGGTLVVAEGESIRDPKLLFGQLRRHRVNTLLCVPSLLDRVLDAAAAQRVDASSLRVIVAGEVCPPSLVGKAAACGWISSFHNEYGPTEATVWATERLCPLDSPSASIPIGRPIPGAKVYVLDPWDRPVPPGCRGQIVLGGPGVARGYLNLPGPTSERFAADPFSREAGARVYRTGDLGRWRSDGELEFLGRQDDQVKLRGYRIELAEIETLLHSFPGISHAAVALRATAMGESALCAYFVAAASIDIAEVRAHLSRSLPDYMIPSYFTRLPALPTTPNGKVDKSRLPAPDRATSLNADAIAPRTEAERFISEAWREVLGLDNIGVHDSFFVIGGDSLKALRLFSKLSTRFDFTMTDLFDHPTIADFASAVEGRDGILTRLKDIRDHADSYAPEPLVEIPRSLPALYASLVRPPVALSVTDSSYQEILISGATGYLGAHILREYLLGTDAQTHLLVRASTQEEAESKFAANYDYYFPRSERTKLSNRIHVLVADASVPDLALGGASYLSLAQRVDLVINAAAKTQHYGDYEDFYASNVRSVGNLVRFCSEGRHKRFLHISTMSVMPQRGPSFPGHTFTELDPATASEGDENYYIRTKSLAESIIVSASGLRDYLIIRAGNIAFNSATGRLQRNAESNAFMLRLATFARIGLIPERTLINEYSFVDQTAEAIRLLSSIPKHPCRVYHLFNDERYPIDDALRAMGGDVPRILPFPDFMDALIALRDEGRFTDEIGTLIAHGHIDYIERGRYPKPLCEYTKAVLAAKGFKWKSLEEEENQRVLKSMMSVLGRP